METLDVLIIGGGAAGMSCALILGSAKPQAYAKNKTIGIIMHQKSSALTNGKFFNALGIESGITGRELLENGKNQITKSYPHINQIEKEKVTSVLKEGGVFKITTNKNTYTSKIVVVAIGPSKMFNITGLNKYVEPHRGFSAEKERIQLKNTNHLVIENIFVAGVLAGWRSQFAIASGSGAQVATDILTKWNNGIDSTIHDSIS